MRMKEVKVMMGGGERDNSEEGNDDEEENESDSQEGSDNREAKPDDGHEGIEEPGVDIVDGFSGYASDEMPHSYTISHDDCADPKLDNEGKEFVLPFNPLEKGMSFFSSVDAFKLAFKKYAVREGFTVIRDKNEKQMVNAHSNGKRCKWKMHALVAPDGISFMIKTYKAKHTCVRVDKNEEGSAS